MFEEIAILDVQLACDVLRPVWDEANGADGFVSLEVEPAFAHETEKTVAQARDYWERVDRPNLMVKIPGTEEGVPAIEETIAAGINVNVTLLFSVESYETIAEAYIRGMERRKEAGESLDVHSVASFFVSRVDTEVDKRLAELGKEDLRGIAAVANARAAYMRFKELFYGERFAALREAGAPVQRPLWASTGVKDPHYPETKYVDSLVGPDTVNTMPMNTLLACAEELEVTGNTADQDPSEDLKRLADAGIDMGDVTKKLLKDGIDKFVEPFDDLIGGIELAREGIVTGRPKTIKSTLPDDLEPPIIERVQTAQAEDVAKRVWARDESLWGGPGVAEIGNRLGWLTISDKMLEHAADLHAFAEQAKADGLEHAVLLGMGGSSLGPEVIRRSYGDVPDGLRLHVLDSTDPGAVLRRRSARWTSTRRCSSSRRSPAGRSRRCRTCATSTSARGGDGSRFCAVTDPGSPLIDEARERGFRRVFENDPDIGGRYSVLSYFGLVPAVLAGVNIEGMLRQAQVAEQNCQQYDSPRAELRAVARLRDGRARAARPRQAHLRGLRADLELRAVGRAAGRRVDRQGGQGHPAGGGRAARRPGRLRRRPRVRVPAQRGRAGRGAGREDRGARARRAPDRHRARSAAAPATSAGSSSSPSSPPRWPAGRSGSTRSTSRTCRRRRTTPRGSWRRACRTRTRARSRTCWRRPRRRSTSRSSAS